MNIVKIFAASAFLFLMTILATGCSGGLNEVTGTVTLNGKPVKGLEITFEPKDPSKGTEAIGYTQADGTYKLHYPGDQTGAPAGEYIVHITGSEIDGEGEPVRIPAKYNSQSELTRTITSGSNTIDFELTTE